VSCLRFRAANSAMASDNFLVGGIQSFSGVDTANPIDVEAGQTTPSGTAHDTPSVTTTTANAMLVTSHTYASANTWTPTGLTESYDRPSGNNNATGQSITGMRGLQPTPGATGAKRSTAGGGADVGVTHILALRRFVPNSPPTVSLTSPANGSTYNAPASVTLTATASDSDGTIQKVDFYYGGTNLIGTVTSAPYTLPWTNVAQGSYSITAVATGNLNATTTSAPVSITVNRAMALNFIEVDHLNTPRLIEDANLQVVWRWDQQEPFGVNVADENPSGLGAYEFPLRFPGQYADIETGLAYNLARDYDPGIVRYVESDPLGLKGQLNTYSYVMANPLSFADPSGLLRIAKTCGPAASAAISKGERNLKNFLEASCGTCKNAGKSCIDCDLAYKVLRQLDQSEVSCGPGKVCANGQVGGSRITMMPLGLTSTCGCVASTLLHELLHNIGLSHRDPGDPITAIDTACRGMCR